jgi:hypothetical protein
MGRSPTLLHSASRGSTSEPRAIVLAGLVNTNLYINPCYNTYIIHGLRQIVHQPWLRPVHAQRKRTLQTCRGVSRDGAILMSPFQQNVARALTGSNGTPSRAQNLPDAENDITLNLRRYTILISGS